MVTARRVRSFKDIEENAQVTIGHFLSGYRGAMLGIPACDRIQAM